VIAFFARKQRWRKIKARRNLARAGVQTQASQLTLGNTSGSQATAKKAATCSSVIPAIKELSASAPTFARLALSGRL